MQSYSSRIVSPFYGLINRCNLNYFFILATIPLNSLNCTFYKKLQCHQENMETSYYIYDAFIFFLSKLSEKSYKRRHDHCERKWSICKRLFNKHGEHPYILSARVFWVVFWFYTPHNQHVLYTKGCISCLIL